VQDDAPNDSSIPTQPGVNRRASQPQPPTSRLKWIGLLLGLLLVGGGTGAVIFFVLHAPPEPEVKPPPARPLFPPGTKASRVPAPASPGPEASPPRDSARAEEKPADVAPAEPRAEAPTVAAVEAAPAAEVAAAPGEAAVPAQGAEEEAAAPVAEAAPAPVDSESDELSNDALLAPLRPTTGSTASSSTKRGVFRKRTTPPRSQSLLQKEWTRTKGAYKALTRTVGCEQLDLLCKRYDYLEGQVSRAGPEEEAALLSKVKELHQDINLKAKGGS